MSSLHAFSAWLATTPVNAAVTAHGWIVPAIQVVHIVAIAAVAIGVALINLRALGWIEQDRPTAAVAAQWLPVVLVAVAVLALTGVLLIASEPGRALFRTVFWVKLALIPLALGATALHRRLADHPYAPRLLALASLALWLVVIFAGRWIAYADAWAGSGAAA